MEITGWIKIIIGFATLIWAALLPVYGVHASLDLLKPYSLVVGIVTAVVIVFDLYLWRIPVIRHLLSKKTLIDGTWRVLIKSNYLDPATNLPKSQIAGFAAIRQHFTGLWITLFTEEAISKSATTTICNQDDGTFQVISCYQGVPRQKVRDRSSIHYGAMLLDIVDDSMMILRGHYWTDRGTQGEIELSGRVSDLVSSFEAAKALFEIA